MCKIILNLRENTALGKTNHTGSALFYTQCIHVTVGVLSDPKGTDLTDAF